MRPCFFFSSRRRHTRYWRDWSSDVCSSDLALVVGGALDHGLHMGHVVVRSAGHEGGAGGQGDAQGVERRSEERRVGKECRARWAPSYLKKEWSMKEDG